MGCAILVEVSAARGFGRHAAAVRRSARRSLELLEERDCELSVALVDDAAIAELNATWRSKRGPTDVLAFAQREGEEMGASHLLGDVVISIPTAGRQAAERGHPVEREVRELLVHGILHLLGYDHERSPAEARRMARRQRELLAALEEDITG